MPLPRKSLTRDSRGSDGAAAASRWRPERRSPGAGAAPLLLTEGALSSERPEPERLGPRGGSAPSGSDADAEAERALPQRGGTAQGRRWMDKNDVLRSTLCLNVMRGHVIRTERARDGPRRVVGNKSFHGLEPGASISEGPDPLLAPGSTLARCSHTSSRSASGKAGCGAGGAPRPAGRGCGAMLGGGSGGRPLACHLPASAAAWVAAASQRSPPV
jgi:hypothetical protein